MHKTRDTRHFLWKTLELRFLFVYLYVSANQNSANSSIWKFCEFSANQIWQEERRYSQFWNPTSWFLLQVVNLIKKWVKIPKISSPSKSREPSSGSTSRTATDSSTETTPRLMYSFTSLQSSKTTPKNPSSLSAKARSSNLTFLLGKTVLKQQTFPDLKEYLSSERPTRPIVEAATVLVVVENIAWTEEAKIPLSLL